MLLTFLHHFITLCIWYLLMAKQPSKIPLFLHRPSPLVQRRPELSQWPVKQTVKSWWKSVDFPMLVFSGTTVIPYPMEWDMDRDVGFNGEMLVSIIWNGIVYWLRRGAIDSTDRTPIREIVFQGKTQGKIAQRWFNWIKTKRSKLNKVEVQTFP